MTEVESEDRARQMASAYNFLLAAGVKAKGGQDEEDYYKNTKISADGKQIIVNFSMPRAAVSEKLTKYTKTPT